MMGQLKITIAALIVLIGSAAARPAFAQDNAQDAAPPPAPAEEQPEVLTRGPVHEAYAQPVDVQTREQETDGVVATAPPPPNVQEQPPAARPDGDRYVWIPGYWSWDAEQHNYIWVSACWRVAPPGMTWMPGYWTKVEGGWRWVPGFWTHVNDNHEIDYLPPPPEPDYAAPPPAPSDDVVWVPPCWYWVDAQYVRRPGYWLRERPAWIWCGSHYVWTPRGYVFAPGHWDYRLEDRGVLFAPVRFYHPTVLVSNYVYTPSTVIEIGVARESFFTCPRYHHYYFGDYYDQTYFSFGIFPWFQIEYVHHYDPIFEHDRCEHFRSDRHWVEHQRHDFEDRRDHRDLRPPRTLHELDARVNVTNVNAVNQLPESQRRSVPIARPLKIAVEDRTTNVRFTQLNVDGRQKIANQERNVQNFRDQRTRWETSNTVAGTSDKAVADKAPLAQQPGKPDTARVVPADRARPETVQPPAAQPGKPDTARPTPPQAPGRSGPNQAQNRAAPPNNGTATPAPTPAPAQADTNQRRENPPPGRSAERTDDTTPPARGSERKDDNPPPARGSQRDDATPAPTARPGPSVQPERVKIPAPPISSPAQSTKEAPAPPADERRRAEPPRDSGRTDHADPRGSAQDRPPRSDDSSSNRSDRGRSQRN
jgi:hypothetical protein